MICETHRVIFVHIPKTAGTSIESFFLQEKNQHEGKHLSLLEYKKWLGPTIDQYAVFSVVRNPWDRMLSYFFWRRKCWRTYEVLHTFRQWCYRVRKIAHGKAAAPQACFERSVMSQYRFLDKLDGVDYVLRFETLNEDFSNLCNRIGLPGRSLPWLLKTKHRHYSEYYTSETRDLIGELYRDDIEAFGYEFDQFKHAAA